MSFPCYLVKIASRTTKFSFWKITIWSGKDFIRYRDASKCWLNEVPTTVEWFFYYEKLWNGKQCQKKVWIAKLEFHIYKWYFLPFQFFATIEKIPSRKCSIFPRVRFTTYQSNALFRVIRFWWQIGSKGTFINKLAMNSIFF